MNRIPGRRACLRACLPRSKLEQTHAGEKASFLPWWGQKNPAGQVGLGPTGIACDRIGLGSLALSTLHQRQPASTRLAAYRYF